MSSIPKVGQKLTVQACESNIVNAILMKQRNTNEWSKEQYRIATLSDLLMWESHEGRISKKMQRMIMFGDAGEVLKANTSSVEEHRERMRRTVARRLLSDCITHPNPTNK